MSTRGWETFIQSTAPPVKRRTVARINIDREDRRRESELLAEVESELACQLAAGAIMDWYHRPDRAGGHGERKGLPDLIIALRPGLVAAVELKRPDGTGRLRPEQVRWLDAWGERGAVCCSLLEVVMRLRDWRVG